MNENENSVRVEEQEERYYQPAVSMDRMYVPLMERISYILKICLGALTLGKVDVGSDIYLYQIYVMSPTRLAKTRFWLVLYDMINDPLTAAIIDNMRSRWGKFKPFQYLAIIPNTVVGFISCILPLIASMNGFDETQRILWYMVIQFASETIGAFIGGGGYIDNVFTPNPNERTQLLTISKFCTDLIAKAPELLAVFLFDLVDNQILKVDVVKMFVSIKTTTWVIATIPGIMWAFTAHERVIQSKKPPKAIKSVTSVFTNAPLLISTLSGALDGIDIGTSESLYFRNVLNMTGFGIVFGIPGSPISYLSYAIAPKLRAHFSTKTLWFFQRGSIFVSESAFFLVGVLGRKKRAYANKLVMGCAYMFGNCLEMFFYALKKIITTEISYEVQDYCEWKNGFRVEATQGLITTYIGKVQSYILSLVNAWILEKWTGFTAGVELVTDERTKYRLFLMAYGPRLVPDFLSMIPMMFYNLTGEKRDRMYAELMERRSAVAAAEHTYKSLDADSTGSAE